jgi:hypothetical protein
MSEDIGVLFKSLKVKAGETRILYSVRIYFKNNGKSEIFRQMQTEKIWN